MFLIVSDRGGETMFVAHFKCITTAGWYFLYIFMS